MKHPLLAALVSTALLAAPSLEGVARAQGNENCPDTPPESAKSRRALAKDWFTRAETAEQSGDQLGSIKAYACSLKMVPHAFTAYNLARVSEKAGDLELALGSYRSYLTMAPEAPDKADVERRIASLQTRIAAVRENTAG